MHQLGWKADCPETKRSRKHTLLSSFGAQNNFYSVAHIFKLYHFPNTSRCPTFLEQSRCAHRAAFCASTGAESERQRPLWPCQVLLLPAQACLALLGHGPHLPGICVCDPSGATVPGTERALSKSVFFPQLLNGSCPRILGRRQRRQRVLGGRKVESEVLEFNIWRHSNQSTVHSLVQALPFQRP